MKELRIVLSFIIILAICMIICAVSAWLVFLAWHNMDAAWSIFFFGTILLMLVSGRLD